MVQTTATIATYGSMSATTVPTPAEDLELATAEGEHVEFPVAVESGTAAPNKT